jgi:hypothetical protein
MTPALPGRWAVRMRTPIGSIDACLTFADTDEGLVGSAEATTETVQLRNIRTVTEADAEHVTWQQSITRPLRLTLDFDVVVREDEMHGHSRAGRLPRSTVTGHRISDDLRHRAP